MFSLYSDEVIFLNDAGNISLEVLFDTLIYQPFRAPKTHILNHVFEVFHQNDESAVQRASSEIASTSRVCRMGQQMTEINNPEPTYLKYDLMHKSMCKNEGVICLSDTEEAERNQTLVNHVTKVNRY